MIVNRTLGNLLGDGIGRVTLLECMGGDQAIVDRTRKCYQSQERSSPQTDAALLRKQIGMRPLHGTTLRNTVMTFDVLAPLFVVRQITRHIIGHDHDGNDVWHAGGQSFDVGAAFDEQSFRFVDASNAVLYTPARHRLQRAGDGAVELWAELQARAMVDYQRARSSGLPKELARCFLPSSVYSQFEWTANMQGIIDFLSKRLPGDGAQWETAQYALAVLALARKVAPQTIAAWEERHEKA